MTPWKEVPTREVQVLQMSWEPFSLVYIVLVHTTELLFAAS